MPETPPLNRRHFFGTAGSYAGAIAALPMVSAIPAAAQTSLPDSKQNIAPHQVVTARSLGAAGDGTGDDGAILTAALGRLLDTLATRQSSSPILIDLGDSRSIYRLRTPIRIRQNYVILSGNGAILDCAGENAIVGDHADSDNILFGMHVRGLTLKGTLSGDAIAIRSGSQCRIENIRNFANVAGAIVRLGSVLSSWTRGIASDGTFGSSCRHLIHESVYEKWPSTHFHCIANRHTELVGYECTGAGVFLDESDSFHISGDFEKCGGPAVDLLNCRFGTVSVYTEVNGQNATNIDQDTPDDIRIRSAPGKVLSRSSNITIVGSQCGGEAVGGIRPNNIHLQSADECLIINNTLAANIRIDNESRRNHIGVQARAAGSLIDEGIETVSLLSSFSEGGFIGQGAIGYGRGAGGSVRQQGSKTADVRLDKLSGEIILHKADLRSGEEAAFYFLNTAISQHDEINVWRKSGGRSGAYTVRVDGVSDGACTIIITNKSLDTLAEHVTIGFTVRKGAIS